jgi:hypothetical protein
LFEDGISRKCREINGEYISRKCREINSEYISRKYKEIFDMKAFCKAGRFI